MNIETAIKEAEKKGELGLKFNKKSCNEKEYKESISYEPILADTRFYEELQNVRDRYQIQEGNGNDTSRRRIAKTVLELFLRYHPLQEKLDIDSFQMLANMLEVAMYQKLKDFSFTCEATDEEIRLSEKATHWDKKRKQRRKLTKAEIRNLALKISWENTPADEMPDDYDKLNVFINDLIQILKGEDYVRREEESGTGEFVGRAISDIADIGELASL